MFCPKCSSMLVPKGGVMSCSGCSYKQSEGVLKEKRKKEKKIEVAIKGQDEHRTITKENCEKCGNEKAYFWSLQTRSSDEPETRFFECTKCKHSWREY